MILIRDIQQAIADRQHIGMSAIKGPRGPIKIVRARHAAMYLARRLTAHSYTVIGKHFGGRDHSTVCHGFRRCQQRIHSNQRTEIFIASMIDQLTAAE
jgi:chromosomal replication initiator protein